ncbi:MAG TPA: RNA polymerase sigma factor [Terracidiphilus sp.]|nr:RNA polymerase sigma factor [Terracidiphilus sp.]
MSSGEEAEFTAMVMRQSRFVFRVAYAVLLNAHDAEDAVQETFLKLYRHGGWQHAKNERAFLARVAWRAAVDRRRAAVSSRAMSITPEPETPVIDPPSLRPGPEEMLEAANAHAVVHAMIDALPEELRVPLALSAFEELNSREIGRILSIPEGTVRTRLQRAREVLRQKIAAMEQSHFSEVRHAR